MTMIDNIKGFSINVGGNRALEYTDKIKMQAYKNKFYGETESPDCPPKGGFCFKVNKLAVMASVAVYPKGSEHAAE